MTRYGYENGRLVRESRQNGLVGTYQYDSGKFTGVVYTDGRYINAAYAPNGALLGLTSDTSARVKFNVKSKPRPRTAFAMIQRGIAALRNPSTANACIATDDDNTCTIVIEGETEDEDDDSGGDGGTIYIGQNDFPVSGEGGGGGSIASPNNNLPPEECKAQICDAGLKTGTRICAIETNGNLRRMAKCESKNFEFYVKCLKSCENGDWSWMENFNYIWE